MTVLFTNLYIFWLIAHILSPYPLWDMGTSGVDAECSPDTN
jgi:hypothetical protein